MTGTYILFGGIAGGIFFREFDTLHEGLAGDGGWPLYLGGLAMVAGGLALIAAAGTAMSAVEVAAEAADDEACSPSRPMGVAPPGLPPMAEPPPLRPGRSKLSEFSSSAAGRGATEKDAKLAALLEKGIRMEQVVERLQAKRGRMACTLPSPMFLLWGCNVVESAWDEVQSSYRAVSDNIDRLMRTLGNEAEPTAAAPTEAAAVLQTKTPPPE